MAAKKQSVETLVKKLDGEISHVYASYTDLHEELNKHRGKHLDDTNLAEVNRILKSLQDTFAELYPAYHFIATRYQHVVNATNSYNEFIDSLKKAGATQEAK